MGFSMYTSVLIWTMSPNVMFYLTRRSDFLFDKIALDGTSKYNNNQQKSFWNVSLKYKLINILHDVT